MTNQHGPKPELLTSCIWVAQAVDDAGEPMPRAQVCTLPTTPMQPWTYQNRAASPAVLRISPELAVGYAPATTRARLPAYVLDVESYLWLLQSILDAYTEQR